MVEIPDMIRRAMEAQGKVDVDAVAAKAAEILESGELDAPTPLPPATVGRPPGDDRQQSLLGVVGEPASAWNGWHPISDRTWQEMTERAGRLDTLSQSATNTRRWSPDFNLLGCLGEALYAMLSGHEMNKRIEIRDGGTDFPGVDVKATSHWQAPRLLRLATDPLKADRYVLVAVDLEGRRARLVGQATREMLRAAEVREYGHGPTRTLHEGELLPVDFRTGYEFE